MTKEEAINTIIAGGCDTNKISDGYHTFEELYEHRIELFIALCHMITLKFGTSSVKHDVWKSMQHSDGTSMAGWFVMGIGRHEGEQITYHLPMKYWDQIRFAEVLSSAPKWDGHTSNDVLTRLRAVAGI